MDFNDIMQHFNALGFEIEQYGCEDDVVDAMYESLLEDGLVPDFDEENFYYECEHAAKCMWSKYESTLPTSASLARREAKLLETLNGHSNDDLRILERLIQQRLNG